MTEKDQLLLNELKLNVRRLIDKLERTRHELDVVRDEKDSLETQLLNYKGEYQALSKRYENLKVAMAFAEGDPDNQAAKLKINKIIREVDKCIALLNK